MSDTRKIIHLEDNTPKRDASRLEGQNEGYNEFFLGAFSKQTKRTVSHWGARIGAICVLTSELRS